MLCIKSYCGANLSISRTWVDGGISPCFYFTLVPTTLLTLAFLLGTVHCVVYQKYGATMEAKFIPRSPVYVLQQALSVLLLAQFAGGMVWRVAAGGELPGYLLLYGCFSALGWAWALAALRVERRRALVLDRTGGHSAALLLFYGVAFSAENLTFVSWYSPHWWWALEDSRQQVRTERRKNDRDPRWNEFMGASWLWLWVWVTSSCTLQSFHFKTAASCLSRMRLQF